MEVCPCVAMQHQTSDRKKLIDTRQITFCIYFGVFFLTLLDLNSVNRIYCLVPEGRGPQQTASPLSRDKTQSVKG